MGTFRNPISLILKFNLLEIEIMNIGGSIEELETLINTPMVPPPNWARRWQTEAEHILAMAHFAKDKSVLEKLKMLDGKAIKLIEERKSKLG